ncbi:MAG: hypothetical protein ACRYHQ_24460 [Janthinobacterium lividum]
MSGWLYIAAFFALMLVAFWEGRAKQNGPMLFAADMVCCAIMVAGTLAVLWLLCEPHDGITFDGRYLTIRRQ